MADHNGGPDERPDYAALMRQMQAVGGAFESVTRAVEKLAAQLVPICDAVITAQVEVAASEFEMDDKLRAEVGLRTDLLALFDEEPT